MLGFTSTMQQPILENRQGEITSQLILKSHYKLIPQTRERDYQKENYKPISLMN